MRAELAASRLGQEEPRLGRALRRNQEPRPSLPCSPRRYARGAPGFRACRITNQFRSTHPVGDAYRRLCAAFARTPRGVGSSDRAPRPGPRRGSPRAGRRAIRLSQAEVWRVAAHLVGQSEADDVTRDVYVRAWRALPGSGPSRAGGCGCCRLPGGRAWTPSAGDRAGRSSPRLAAESIAAHPPASAWRRRTASGTSSPAWRPRSGRPSC
jgi:hypothetical protein